jgi:hypothetical protein
MPKRKTLIPVPQPVADALAVALASMPSRRMTGEEWDTLRQRAEQATKRVYKPGHGPRRFPVPWSYVETGEDRGGYMAGTFTVKDANGWPVAYVYYDDEPTRRTTAKSVSRDEARRLAANIARLPELILREKAAKRGA